MGGRRPHRPRAVCAFLLYLGWCANRATGTASTADESCEKGAGVGSAKALWQGPRGNDPKGLAPGPQPFLVLKQARSGSSWFASLVAKLKGVVLFEEVITTSTSQDNSQRRQETYLAAVLKGTTDARKISSFNHRRVARHTLSKFRDKLAIGATMNPVQSWNKTHDTDGFRFQDASGAIEGMLHFQKILAPIGGTLVLYVRTNVVKMAVARWRGRELQRKGGETNQRASR